MYSCPANHTPVIRCRGGRRAAQEAPCDELTTSPTRRQPDRRAGVPRRLGAVRGLRHLPARLPARRCRAVRVRLARGRPHDRRREPASVPAPPARSPPRSRRVVGLLVEASLRRRCGLRRLPGALGRTRGLLGRRLLGGSSPAPSWPRPSSPARLVAASRHSAACTVRARLASSAATRSSTLAGSSARGCGDDLLARRLPLDEGEQLLAVLVVVLLGLELADERLDELARHRRARARWARVVCESTELAVDRRAPRRRSASSRRRACRRRADRDEALLRPHHDAADRDLVELGHRLDEQPVRPSPRSCRARGSRAARSRAGRSRSRSTKSSISIVWLALG